MADVVIKVVADTTQAERGLKRVGDAGKSASGEVAKGFDEARLKADLLDASLKTVAAGALAAVAGLTAAAAATVQLAADIDVLAKTSRGVGATAGELQELQRALELSGVGAEGTTALVQRLSRSLGDAARKAGPARDALDELGLSAEELGALPLPDRVARIVGALSDLEDQGTRASISAELLGRQSRDLQSALEQGVGPLQANIDAVRELGSVNQQTADDSEALTDSVTLLTQQWEQLKSDALAPLIPLVGDLADGLRELVSEMQRSLNIASQSSERMSELEKAQEGARVSAQNLAAALAHLDEVEGAAVVSEVARAGALRRVEAALAATEVAERALAEATGALAEADDEGADSASRHTAAIDEQIDAMKKAAEAVAQLEKDARRLAAEEGDAAAAVARRWRIAYAAKMEAAREAAAEAVRLAKEQKAAEGAAAEAMTEKAQQERRNQTTAAAEAVAVTGGLLSGLAEQYAQTAEALGSETIATFARVTESIGEAMQGAGSSVEGVIAAAGAAVLGVLGLIAAKEAEQFAARQERYENTTDQLAELNAKLATEISASDRELTREQIKSLRKRQAAEREAAREQFKQQQTLATIQAVIAGALAIVQGFAQLGPIGGAISAGIITAITGVQIGLIQSQSPPFHMGGVVPGAAASSAAGETPARLLPGEGVVNRDGMERLGPDGLDALNRGDSAGLSAGLTANLVFRSEVLASANAENDRRGVVSSRAPRSRAGTQRPVAYVG